MGKGQIKKEQLSSGGKCEGLSHRQLLFGLLDSTACRRFWF
ncbi:unnamed protein product [Onchocerca flexuosa]|uniref:Uncharacterized protein n=1 Tax=Onchocerca flexuosa TaxID=387005 RepID=A0A183HA35_9BILA|nr:unnamed protein product [Onchocerca flexuosa]